MREFAIPYSDGLRRGLRRFPVSQRQEEWLTDCHNLMPTEAGLISHETILSIGVIEPTDVTFETFRLKNQNGLSWYWFIDNGQILSSSLSPPSIVGMQGSERTSATIPSWLKIASYDNLTPIYVYPNVDGSPFSDTNAPGIGTEHDAGNGLSLISVDGSTYKILTHSGGSYEIDTDV